jgi:hypothetical protein
MAMSGAGGGKAMSNASWGSSPAGSPRNTFDKKGGSSRSVTPPYHLSWGLLPRRKRLFDGFRRRKCLFDGL